MFWQSVAKKRSDRELMEFESETRGSLKKAKKGVELLENSGDDQLIMGLSKQTRKSK